MTEKKSVISLTHFNFSKKPLKTVVHGFFSITHRGVDRVVESSLPVTFLKISIRRHRQLKSSKDFSAAAIDLQHFSRTVVIATLPQE
jgi:hypothetical protein